MADPTSSSVVCNCGLIAVELIVKKDGPNKGRKVFKCPNPKGSQCGFFKWADDISTSDLQSETRAVATPSSLLVCNCGQNVKEFTVKKEGPNKGRKFLKCPKPKGSQCDFFKWADDISTSDLQTRVGQSESSPMSQVSGRHEGSIPTQSYDTSQQPDISNQDHYIQPHSTPLSDSASAFTHSQEESEAMDSSTSAEKDSPDFQSVEGAMYPRPGTERRLSADSTPYKQACKGESTTQGGKGQKRPSTACSKDELPLQKRHSSQQSNEETKTGESSDMPPTELSRQHIQRETRTVAYQEPASGPPFKLILKENQPYLVEHINLMSLLPHLNAQQLLSDAESEELQLRQVPEHDRIIRLLTILQKKGESGFHRFLVALEQASDHTPHRDIAKRLKHCSSGSTSLPAPSPPNPTTAIIANNLKSIYTGQHFFQRSAGPGFGVIEFIHLALVKKQGVSEENRWKDKFLKAALHGLVEDIVKEKSRLDMGDIFKYGKRARKLMLVEGAPGVGKTMLAMKLCQSWAEGTLLGEYDVVFLVELQRFQGATKLTLEDLVGVHLEGEIATKVAQHFMATAGKKLLIILDGWDKLSPKLRHETSFFFDLVKGDKLPNASIMVTSRPSVTAPLYDHMSERRVEVLGFNKKQQDEYIQKNVPDDEVAQMVLDYFQKFPNLRALAHIPLILAIICSVATKCSSLPVTLTELYDRYTCNALMGKKSDECFQSLSGLNSLDEMPSDAHEIVTSLCKLALESIKQKSFIPSFSNVLTLKQLVLMFRQALMDLAFCQLRHQLKLAMRLFTSFGTCPFMSFWLH